ncbi:diguanylate cyclase [Candidatus Reidiella endopervernicosa]|uniref:Diguanylate cyclase n=1 Tax=Candidatus Reidiella endopervernicosa TaxID=2738883 RepID=A0A6N0HSC0_9GAMM|nr:diguanylate cyclase [Candidatus Reidiella endopervernicosa]
MRMEDLLVNVNGIDAGSVVARLGGDEFIVLLGELDDVRDAAKVAERIIFSPCTGTAQGNEIYVSASIGITISPDDGIDSTELVKNADIASIAPRKAASRATGSIHTRWTKRLMNAFTLRTICAGCWSVES